MPVGVVEEHPRGIAAFKYQPLLLGARGPVGFLVGAAKLVNLKELVEQARPGNGIVLAVRGHGRPTLGWRS